MPFMEWEERMATGIESIDSDHLKLVAIINELHDGIRAGHGKDVLGKVLDDLGEYTHAHFGKEERYFEMTTWSGAKNHLKEHAAFTAVVDRARQEYRDSAEEAPSLEIMILLKDWLREHILVSDKKHAPYLKSMGIR